MQSTYWDRENTNANLVKWANEETNDSKRSIRPPSSVIKVNEIKLFGHMLRAENNDPMVLATFESNFKRQQK